jgi:hypothetical protein
VILRRVCISLCVASSCAAAAVSVAPVASGGQVSSTFRKYVQRVHPCLANIIGPESGWDTTVDYGGGHGNVYESYGLGQANPGTKMAAFGADWRTNPWTQLRWIISYARTRYGSECRAWSHWSAYRWW